MASGVRQIAIRFAGDATGLNRAADQAEKRVSKMQKGMKVASAGAVAALGAGAAAIKSGIEGVLEGEAAEEKFVDALTRSTKKVQASSDAAKEKAEWLQKNTKFTYEDGIAIATHIAKQQSLSAVIESGNASMSELQGITANLATVMGVDGVKAADMIAKAMAKPAAASGVLRKAGITLTQKENDKLKAWVKSGKTAEAQGFILDKLSEKTKGAAQAAGDTLTGKMERAKNAFGEVQESLAVGLVPVVTKLAEWIAKLSKWMEENSGKVKVAAIVIGSLAAVIITINTVMKVWTAVTTAYTAVQKAANWVMQQSPIFRWAAIALAVAAALVVLWKRSERFRDIVKGALDVVQTAFEKVTGAVKAVVEWVKDNWPKLLAILTGPFGLAVAAIVKYRDDIWKAFKKVPGWIKSAFSGLVEILTWPFKQAFNGIAGLWNNGIGRLSFKVPGWVPGLGGKGWDVPDIPMLAAGGTVTRAGSVLVGERGPELLSLPRGAQVTPLAAGPSVVEIHATGPTLQDIVRVEIRQANRATVNAVRAGSRRAIA